MGDVDEENTAQEVQRMVRLIGHTRCHFPDASLGEVLDAQGGDGRGCGLGVVLLMGWLPTTSQVGVRARGWICTCLISGPF